MLYVNLKKGKQRIENEERKHTSVVAERKIK